MNNWKYIVLEKNGLEIPVIFPYFTNHKDMVGSEKVIAAGFVRFIATELSWDTVVHSNEIKVFCFGKSESLHIVSRPDNDAYLIMTLLKRALN